MKKKRNCKRHVIVRYGLVFYAVIAAVIVLMFFLPFWLIPRFVPEAMNEQSTAASIFISAWTLEVTIGIAVLIYFLQRFDNYKQYQKEVEDAETAYKRIAKTTVDYLLSSPDSRDQSIIASNRAQYLQYYRYISDVLPEEERILLDRLIAKADNAAKEKNKSFDPDIFRDWLRVFVRSKYSKKIAFVRNPYELLNKQVYQLLQVLHVDGAGADYQEKIYVFTDSSGEKIFEKTDSVVRVDPVHIISSYAIKVIMQYEKEKTELIPDYTFDNSEIIINIFEYSNIVFSGTFDNDAQINNGFQKDENYIGYYKNGLPEGAGIVFTKSFDDLQYNKFKEGYFQNGILKFGVKYRSSKVWQKGEFALEIDDVGKECLATGTVYDYKGGKLKEGTFSRDYRHRIINGIEFNWVIEHISGPFEYNRKNDDFDGDESTEIKEWVQYYDEDGLGVENTYLYTVEDYMENAGSEHFFIADLKIRDTEYVTYVHIRRLETFMRKEDPERYKYFCDLKEKQGE